MKKKSLHHSKCIVIVNLATTQNYIKFSDNMFQCLHGTMTGMLLFDFFTA